MTGKIVLVVGRFAQILCRCRVFFARFAAEDLWNSLHDEKTPSKT